MEPGAVHASFKVVSITVLSFILALLRTLSSFWSLSSSWCKDKTRERTNVRTLQCLHTMQKRSEIIWDVWVWQITMHNFYKLNQDNFKILHCLYCVQQFRLFSAHVVNEIWGKLPFFYFIFLFDILETKIRYNNWCHTDLYDSD